MEYSEIYVNRIKSLCKQRGIAINKLATMSGVNQSTPDNIVRGIIKDPRAKTLHKVAIAFNMTLAEFLDFDELNSVSKLMVICTKNCCVLVGVGGIIISTNKKLQVSEI